MDTKRSYISMGMMNERNIAENICKINGEA